MATVHYIVNHRRCLKAQPVLNEWLVPWVHANQWILILFTIGAGDLLGRSHLASMLLSRVV